MRAPHLSPHAAHHPGRSQRACPPPPPLSLVRLRQIVPGIVPANQSLYKLKKQSD
jgi:hypothetical protein